MYIKGSIEAYLNDLAARKPAPGGGRAAAIQPVARSAPDFGDEQVQQIQRFLALRREHELPEDMRFLTQGVAERQGQPLGAARIALQQMIGHALRRLGADAGQAT